MISEKAFIDPSAKIGKDVEILPFAYIDKDVIIGDGCKIYPYVSLEKGTIMGKNNTIYQNAVLGAIPQDCCFKGEDTILRIGDNNTIRENVVINRAANKGAETFIGNNNYILEGVHISHDAHIENNCAFGIGSKIGANCYIEDKVILNSSVIGNPGTRVGTCTYVRSGCRFREDIPPYIIAANNPIKYEDVNYDILNDIGISKQIQLSIGNAYRILFRGNASLFDSINDIKTQIKDSPEVRKIIEFLSRSNSDDGKGIITKEW